MKKFIIFFLMAFLFFGNSQARSEATVANNDLGNALHEWGSPDANSSLNNMLTPFSLEEADFASPNSVDFAINRDCSTGIVILGVDNPDPGIIYEWRQGATILDTALYYTLPTPTGPTTQSYSLYEIGDVSGYYVTPILIATHNVSTNVSISVDVIPATVGATNPFNLGVNGSSVLTLQATTTTPNPYSPVPFYQWYLNDQPIQDSTNSTYFFPQNMAAGTYYVKVSATDPTTGCVAMSGAFQVNVSEGIVVNIFGTQMACPGQVITLTAQVENDNLGHTYQWLRDGQYIPGQTAQTYSFATDSVIGTHNYTVQINRAGCESVYSPELTVTVVEPPVVILTEPELLCAGGTVTLEANTYSSLSEQPFKWIWYEGTAPVDTLDTTYVNTLVVDSVGLYSVEAVFENIACSALSAADSVMNAPTLAAITLNRDTTVCEGNLIPLTITEPNTTFGTATYQWFVNGMLVDGVSGLSYSYNPVAIGNAQTIYLVSVIANYENYGCATVTDSITITVNPNPTVAITGDALLCNTNTTTLTAHVVPATPVTGTYSYQWYLNNSLISGATSDVYTSTALASNDNPYIYKVQISGANGCSVMSTDYPVYVNENPSVVVTPSENIICAGGEVTFSTYIGHAEDIHYQWSNGGVNISGATLPTYTTTLTATDTLLVTITQDGTACTATGSAIVTVKAIPVISLVLESLNDSICQGGEVILRDTNFQYHSDGVYQWYVNDVLIPGATQEYFSHFPVAVDGDMTSYYYNVSVTLPNSGCQSVLDAPNSFYMVDVFANPTVVIDGDNVVCNGSDLVLTANITGGVSDSVSYIWYNYNDIIGTEATLELDDIKSSTHQPNGVYSITVAINQRTLGCSTVSAPFEVTVADSLTAVIDASTMEICAGGVVTFTAHLNDWNQQDVTYKWFNHGIEIPGATSLVYVDTFMADAEISFEASRTYSTCVVTSNVLSITVIDNPSVTITPTLATLCEGGEVTFTADAEGSGVYTWYKNGVAILGADLNTLTESPLTVGGDSTIYTYYVMYTPETSGCSVAYDTAVVTVYPNVSVAIAGDPIICMDTTVILTANVQDNYSLGTLHYQWKLFNVNTGTDNNTLIQSVPTSDNPYIYSVVVSNTTNNCQAESAPYYVYVNENPHVVVTVSDTLVCEGATLVLTGHLGDYNTPNLTYQWLLNGTDTITGATQITYTATIEEEAFYTLLVRQTTSGCLASGNSPMIHIVDVDGFVDALNIQTNSTDLCDGGEVQVTAYLYDEEHNSYIDSTLTYVWFRNGFLMSGVTGPQFSEALMTVDSDTSHYIYSVYINLPGCGSLNRWFSDTITVRRNPIVVIAGDHVVCDGSDNIVLFAWVDGRAVGSPYTFKWYESGQYRHGAYGSYYKYIEQYAPRTDPYVFTVEIISPNGCSAFSDPFEVMVNANPVVNITTSEDSVCQGGQVTLTANLNDYNADMLTYQWYKNAYNNSNIIIGATQPTYTTTVDETTKYIVYVLQTTSNCYGIDSSIITKFEDPSIASINLSVDTICEGGQVTLTAELDETGVPGSDYIYTWYRNGTLIPDVTGASFTESPLAVDGDITYYVYNVTVAQSAAGCASILNPATAATLMVNPNPTVTVAGDPIVCRDIDSNIVLSANVFPDPAVEGTYTYQWYEDNVAIGGAISYNYITHKAFSENPYNFSVRVTNPYGCSVESDVFSVLVNEHPVVNITSTETTICAGGEVTLTAHLDDWNSGDIMYQWSKDGVEIPGATSLTYTTTLNDTSVFTFNAFQTTSECTATSDSLWINVNPLPVITNITVIDNLDTICEGRQVVLMANVSGGVTGGEIYTWYRNGVEIAGAVHRVYTESPVTVDNEVTTYVYNVVVRQTAAGCASIYDPTDRVTITVNPNPTVTIAGDQIVCRDVPANINLTANVFPEPSVQGIYTYQWFEDNEAITTGTPANANYVDHRIYREYPYNFSVRVSNEYGCSVESDVFSVLVNEHPIVNITSTETTICEGGEITLTAHLDDWNSGDIMYQWSKDGVEIPGATSLTYTTTLTDTSIFTFNAFQTTSECEANSAPLRIDVNLDPIISEIEVVDDLDTICEGRQVVMHAIVEGGVTGGEIFTWYRNGVEIPGATSAWYLESPLTVDNETTIYAYNAIVTQSASGCVSHYDPNDLVFITVNPNPTVAIEGDQIVCQDVVNNIVLSANVFPDPAVQGVYTYQWFEDNVAIDGETNSVFDIRKPYRDYPYNFHVMVTNEYGCSVTSDLFYVYVNASPVVTVTSTETDVCVGGEVTLTAHLNDYNADMLTYQWYANDVLIQGATSNTYTSIVNDSTEFKVNVEQLTSLCATPDSIMINVHHDPVIANISLTETQICEGGQVTVTANLDPEYLGVPESAYTYTWFRNGELMTGITSASFTESPVTVDGDYTGYTYAAFVAQAASGCQSNLVESALLNVYGNPRVTISGDAHICESDSVFLVANVDTISNAVGTLHYTWYEHGQLRNNMAYGLGDSQFYSEHFYASENPYSFTVEVTRENGCTTLSDPFLVYVYETPIVTVTATETEICEGGQVTFTAHLNDINEANITYQWYKVDTLEEAVAVGYGPGSTYIYDTVLTRVVTNIPGATSPNYTVTLDTTSTFGVHVFQTYSECFNTDELTITVQPLPVIDSIIVVDDLDTICEGRQVRMHAYVSGGVTGGEYYTWFRNGVEIEGAHGPVYAESPLTVDNDITTYVYYALVSQTASGCSSEFDMNDLVRITVNPNPTVAIAGDPIVCVTTPDNITLSANVFPDPAVQGPYTYQWFEDNEPIVGQNSDTLRLTKEYREYPYNFSVRVTNAYGCSVESEVFSVIVNAAPIVNITVSEDTICEGGELIFLAHLNDWNAGDIVYQWYQNGVAILGATSLSYITNLNASDVFTFTAYQTTSGCRATSNALQIVVNPLPIIDSISVVDNLENICEGRQVVMTAHVSGGVAGGEYFTWFRNGVEIPGAHLATYAESPVTVDNDVTNYVYNVIVTQTAAGCASILDPTDEVLIVVNPNPTVAIAGDQIVCVETEGNINLTVNAYPVPGIGGNYTYQWFEDNVAITGATSANYVTTKPYREYPYNFSVIVTNQYGCSVESNVFSVTVNAVPVITITSTENLICTGGEVTLTAHLADWNAGDIMYQWFVGGVAIPGATSLTYTTVLNATSQFSFTALQTTSECLATSNTLTVTVNALPVITGITVTDNLTTICEGRQVVMTANVSGGVTGGEVFTWYRNGVEIPNANQATYTESPVTVDNDVTNYVYNVIVTQTAAGCTSILDPADQVTIVVNPNPTVAIAGDQIVCVETEGNINLIANAYPVPGVGGDYTYQWFEDNVAITGATTANYVTTKPYREYPYNFSVIVTNAYGCSVESGVFSVVVNATPIVNISVDETTICENGEVTLMAHLNDWNAGDIVYQWFKNGAAISGATSLTYTTVLTDTTVFSFTALQTTSECLATSNSLTVFVLPTPVVAIQSVLNANICSGGEVTLTATAPNTYNPAMGQATYTWYRNGVVVEGANQYVLTESPLAIDGDLTLYTYNVQVSFTASGCQSDLSAGAVVTVTPTQTVYISASSNLTYCEGGNVILTANVAPVADGYQYQWYRDNVLVGNAATYTSQDLARETAYEYHVVVTNNPGCSVTSESVYVTVVADPVVNVTVDNSTICEGGVAIFTANVEGGVDNVNGLGTYTYAWYNNYSPATPIGTGATYTTLVTDQATTYTYWVVVTSPYGCQTTAYYYNFNIVADPTVNITIASGYDATVCDGGSTMLMANVTGGYGENSYQWYKNGILLVGETNQSIATGALYNNVTAAYTVHVTQTGVNCDVWSQQFNVTVIPTPVVTINGNTNTCPGGTVTLTAIVTGLVAGDVPAYQWYKVANGIATPINGQTNAQFTTSPLLLGDSYEYYVEVSSAISGCSVTSGTVQANVVPEPTVSISGAHTVCEGGILTLNAYVNGGVSGTGYNYLWSWYVNGVLQTATTTVPSFVPVLTANDPSTPYYFTVNISRTDNTGCDATSASFEVNVLPTPQAVVTMDNPVTCLGGAVTFTANVVPVGTYNYTWNVNGVAQGNNQSYITLSNLPVGNNSIYVAISPVNANAACSSVSPVVTAVVVADPVVATVTPSVTAMCVGGTVNLSIGSIVLDPSISTGDYSYQWAINGFEASGAINSQFSQNLNTAGSYSYTVRVSQNDGLGCASGWSTPVVVTVVNQPQVTITSGGYGLVDICQGGQVTLNGNVTNYSTVFGTTTYNWLASNINTGVITNPYNATLNTVGTYNYNAVVSFSGYACQPATSNTISINVNADPSWSSIHVTPIGDMCEGERVTLEASVQGGVQDNVGNTNGIIQWYVVPEGGSSQFVDGGVGGSSWDDPDGAGNFDYFVSYSGQLGSGCSLANGIPNVNSNGFTMTVHALPTAQFTNGDGAIICGNNINDIAGLEITFTGTAPFYFMLQDVTTNQTTAYGPIYQNPYTVYVQPDVTTTYRIINLSDAYCTAAGDPITGAVTSATVVVSDVDFAAELYTTVCGEFDINGYPIARVNINILSGFATNYDAIFVDTENAMFNVYNGTILGSATMGYYLQFSLPSTPGDYDVVIKIDGCEYLITVRVLVAENSFGGQPIVDQRWDDVVVVNNNPANNGGHTFSGFQWYKDGVLIPGATNQYYQEIGGLNGFYSVTLFEYNAETGEYIEYMTCEFFFSSRTNIKVYPVPAETQQQITIELDLTPEELDGAILDIYDVRGAHVQQINSLQPVTKVDGFKTPGTYFGRIITGTNEIKTVKFIIVK